MRSRARLAVAAIVATAAALLAAPPAASLQQPEGTTAALSFAAEGSGVSRPGEAVTFSGTVTNLSEAPLPAGTVDLSITREVLGSEELAVAYSDPRALEAEPLASVSTPPLPVSGTASVSVVVPPETLDPLLAGEGWGSHAVVAALRESDAISASAVVRLDGDGPEPARVGFVLPVTVPAAAGGLLSAEELDQFVAPAGVLTRALEAARVDPQITLALDPRILASIRALGASAPATAATWLEEFQTLPNDVIALQYADADTGLQREAGAPSPLQPTSFLAATGPADFPEPTPTPTSPSNPGATESPTPTTTATATVPPGPAVPTLDELLAFDYTASDVNWPASGTVAPEDLAFAAQAGLTRTLVTAAQVTGERGSPVAQIGGGTVLVADSTAPLVADAISALGTAETRLAVSRAAGALAARAVEQPGSALLLPAGRDVAHTGDRASALRSLSTLPWVTPVGFDAIADASEPSEPSELTPAEDFRVEKARSLLEAEGSIAAFATVLEQPELLTGPARLDLLAALSASWAEDQDGWDAAVSALQEQTRQTLNSVSIDPSSQINVASFEADAPIAVTNALPYPVTVEVVPRASNGRILIEGTRATIEPESVQRVSLQAKAVANGRVTVAVRLYSPTGVEVGQTRIIQLDVQPYWEIAGITALSVLVLALLVFGTVRSIRRGRRQRTQENDSADAGEPTGDNAQ